MSLVPNKKALFCLSIILSASLVSLTGPSQAQESLPAESELTPAKDGNEKPAKGKVKKEEKAESAPVSHDPSRPYNEACIREYNAGVELHQQGFLNQAIQKYRAAIAADDRIEPAYCNLGLIYCAQRNWGRAMETLKKAIALKPNNPFTLNGMGSVLYSKGKLKEAMEHWQRALEADKNFASAYFNIGNAYENEKDSEKALANYVLSIKANASMADAYYKIGCLFAKQKHNAQATTMLAKALQLSPDADFVADARKQINGIAGQLSKEDDQEAEVKMNIVAPLSKDTE